MKFLLVGPGAIGCLFAAYLSKNKEQELYLLDKPKLQRTGIIKKNGIEIEGVSGKWNAKIKITSDINEVKNADCIIICVKSYDTLKAIRSVKSLVNDRTDVITLQNGVGNLEIIADVLGSDNVIGAVTNQGATVLGQGKIRHAGRGETILGRMDRKITARLRTIREIFNKVGLEAKISKDIKGIIWSKLIVNVGINALTAVTRLNNGQLVKFEGTRQILKDAVTEAIKVAKKKRIRLIYDDMLAKVESVCESTSANISSMLQDVLKNKKTEVDSINGAVVRQGQSLSIPTPINLTLTNLVKTIESSYKLQLS